jgi:hypothetical protein
VTNPVSLSSFYCMYNIPLLLDSIILLHFSHDRSNWSSPFFPSTTFQNFPDTSDLFSEVSTFQHHTKILSQDISLGLRKNICNGETVFLLCINWILNSICRTHKIKHRAMAKWNIRYHLKTETRIRSWVLDKGEQGKVFLRVLRFPLSVLFHQCSIPNLPSTRADITRKTRRILGIFK